MSIAAVTAVVLNGMFIAALFLYAYTHSPGAWNAQLQFFWQTKKFPELIAMAHNLERIQQEDAHVIFYAFAASVQLKDAKQVEYLGIKFMNEGSPDPFMETFVAKNLRPENALHLMKGYRTRAVAVLTVLLILANLAVLRFPNAAFISAFLAAAGSVLLLF